MFDIEEIDNLAPWNVSRFVNGMTIGEYFEFLRGYLGTVPKVDDYLATSFRFDVYHLSRDVNFLPPPIPDLVKIYGRTNPISAKRELAAEGGMLGSSERPKSSPTSMHVHISPSPSDRGIVFYLKIYVPDIRSYDKTGAYMPIANYLSQVGEDGADLLKMLEQGILIEDMRHVLNVLTFEGVELQGYGNKIHFSRDPPKNKSARK